MCDSRGGGAAGRRTGNNNSNNNSNNNNIQGNRRFKMLPTMVPTKQNQPDLDRESIKQSSQLDNERTALSLPLLSSSTSSPPVSTGKVVLRPTDMDVLLGRGRPLQQHPGNIRLHRVVDQFRDTYQQSRKKHKVEIVKTVVNLIHNDGGRFLIKHSTSSSKDDDGDHGEDGGSDGDGGGESSGGEGDKAKKPPITSGTWIEVPLQVALEKTGHALRGRQRYQSGSSFVKINRGPTNQSGVAERRESHQSDASMSSAAAAAAASLAAAAFGSPSSSTTNSNRRPSTRISAISTASGLSAATNATTSSSTAIGTGTSSSTTTNTTPLDVQISMLQQQLLNRQQNLEHGNSNNRNDHDNDGVVSPSPASSAPPQLSANTLSLIAPTLSGVTTAAMTTMSTTTRNSSSIPFPTLLQIIRNEQHYRSVQEIHVLEAELEIHKRQIQHQMTTLAQKLEDLEQIRNYLVQNLSLSSSSSLSSLASTRLPPSMIPMQSTLMQLQQQLQSQIASNLSGATIDRGDRTAMLFGRQQGSTQQSQLPQQQRQLSQDESLLQELLRRQQFMRR